MFRAIGNLFQKLNNHFTYRQRFVFFSFVFILTTPIPGYWLIKVERFFIQRASWQLQGVHFQSVAGDLFHDAVRYRLLTLGKKNGEVWKETNEELLRNIIEQRYQTLAKLIQDTTFGLRPNLGYGFTSVFVDAPNLEPSYALWLRVIDSNEASPQEKQQVFRELLLSIGEIQEQISDVFLLTLTPTHVLKNLTIATMDSIPEAEFLISEIVMQAISPENTTELERTITTKKLETNFSQTDQNLSNTFFLYATELKALGKTYTTAKQTLVDYLGNGEKFIQEIKTNHPASLMNSSFKTIEASNNLRNLNETMITLLFKKELSWFQNALTASLTVYITVALMLTFYLIFRVLTRHLMEICYHLREMTRGNFKTCFTSHFNDEFGMIGRTFDKMSHSVQDVLGELKKLGDQLTDSIMQITRTAKAQEDNAASQEQKVKEIESTAKLIAQDSRELANQMNDLNTKSSESSVADTAKEGLDRMQEKMVTLAGASNDIITNLSLLDEKVRSAHALIAFMTKVSDQARLLSLNSAIETASISTNRASFLDITKKIQRFATKTSESTEEIRHIINEISESVVKVRQEAHGCLGEITEGAHRLINLSNQLTMITRQGKEQIQKFVTVNDVMQMQAIAAENIIKSISQLGETAEENTRSIRTLQNDIQQLGKTAEELQKSIGLFV